MARQLMGKWTNGKAANRWESQFLTQDVGGGAAQDHPTNGKATNKADNRWESQFLTQDVGEGGAQEQPTNGKATNGYRLVDQWQGS